MEGRCLINLYYDVNKNDYPFPYLLAFQICKLEILGREERQRRHYGADTTGRRSVDWRSSVPLTVTQVKVKGRLVIPKQK